MNLYEKIQQILQEKKVSFSTFAEHIGIPEDQLRDSFEKNSLEIRELEVISKELKIPLYRFFREPIGELVPGSYELSPAMQQELAQLKLQLDFARKEIETLKLELESKNELIKHLQLDKKSI